MEEEIKDKLNKMFNEDNQLQAKTILFIKSRPRLTVSDDDEGMELNDGYEFEVNGALPEIADSIAKLAFELDNQGFGEGSGEMFVSLILEYFKKLQNKE